MKVCQLCAVDFTLHHFLLPLIDGMQAEAWEVISVCADGKYISDLRERGYRIETVPLSRSLNPFANLRALWKLVRLFRHHRFDAVHVHTPVAALVGRIAATIARVPLVIYTAHGFYFHDEMPRWKRRIFVALEKLGGWMTDLLFTQSAEDAETAVKEGILTGKKITAIGNGVDAARFTPSKQIRDTTRLALGISEDTCLIGMIGRLVAEKGVVEFLQAAMQVAERRPQVTFILIGDRLESDHAGHVEDVITAARFQLGNRLILAGLRSDIPELLAAMDVFCLPSYREGMPRTIIEAMMMGKPVIATNIRGSREEVQAEKTGLLVPTREAHSLADAMWRCANNPTWAQRLGQTGRQRALELYDEKRVVDKQIEIIKGYLA